MRKAISIFGTDRPGIIAELTQILADEGVNIEDASMTLLQGHFAMILVADIPNSDTRKIETNIKAHKNLNNLSVMFAEFEEQTNSERPDDYSRYVFHLSVNDSPGIVSHVAQTLAQHRANIVDCATRKTNQLFTIVLDVDVPKSVEQEVVNNVSQLANEYAGDVVFQSVDDVDL